MGRRLAFVVAAGLALSGCCPDGVECSIPRSTNARAKLDALGPLPKPKQVKRAKARNTSKTALTSKDHSPSDDELSKLKPYSKEWHAALDAIERAADDELKRKLVICRGCMSPEPDDQTGSIAPKRAAEGYLSLETSRSVSLPLTPPSSDGLR